MRIMSDESFKSGGDGGGGDMRRGRLLLLLDVDGDGVDRLDHKHGLV